MGESLPGQSAHALGLFTYHLSFFLSMFTMLACALERIYPLRIRFYSLRKFRKHSSLPFSDSYHSIHMCSWKLRTTETTPHLRKAGKTKEYLQQNSLHIPGFLLPSIPELPNVIHSLRVSVLCDICN